MNTWKVWGRAVGSLVWSRAQGYYHAAPHERPIWPGILSSKALRKDDRGGTQWKSNCVCLRTVTQQVYLRGQTQTEPKPKPKYFWGRKHVTAIAYMHQRIHPAQKICILQATVGVHLSNYSTATETNCGLIWGLTPIYPVLTKIYTLNHCIHSLEQKAFLLLCWNTWRGTTGFFPEWSALMLSYIYRF